MKQEAHVFYIYSRQGWCQEFPDAAATFPDREIKPKGLGLLLYTSLILKVENMLFTARIMATAVYETSYF